LRTAIENQSRVGQRFLSLKDRGFKSPKLAVGDGALGFWRKIEKNYWPFMIILLIIGHTSEPPTQSNQLFLRFGRELKTPLPVSGEQLS
jgi:hypothetical protein